MWWQRCRTRWDRTQFLVVELEIRLAVQVKESSSWCENIQSRVIKAFPWRYKSLRQFYRGVLELMIHHPAITTCMYSTTPIQYYATVQIARLLTYPLCTSWLRRVLHTETVSYLEFQKREFPRSGIAGIPIWIPGPKTALSWEFPGFCAYRGGVFANRGGSFGGVSY